MRERIIKEFNKQILTGNPSPRVKATLLDLMLDLEHPIHLKFAVDMDDTLVDSYPTFCDHIRKLNPAVGEINVRESHDLIGITLEEWFQYMNDNKLLHDMPKKGKSLDILRRLKSYETDTFKVTVDIFTSRGFYNDAEAVTRNWLHANNFVPDSIHVIPFGVSKAHYMKSTGVVYDFFFDDVASDCFNAVEIGAAKCALMIEMPWNEFVELRPNVHRIYCVSEFSLKDHVDTILGE